MEAIKIFGFDIGISSIGFAYVENGELKDCGVRIFTKAEQPKTGASLALPRREARSVRRRLSRRRGRLNTIKQILCAEFGLELHDYLSSDGILPKAYTSTKGHALKSPYELRTLALRQKLDPADLARIVLHIAKHRGYGNKHTKASKDPESGKVKKAIEANRKILRGEQDSVQSGLESGGSRQAYESVGEYLYKELFQKPKDKKVKGMFVNVRNKNGDYTHCMAQDLLREELVLIFTRQRQYGWNFQEGFEDKILDKAFEQRPLNSFEHMIGDCIFFPDEKRAPKDAPSAIEFVALSRIINTLAGIAKKTGDCYGRDLVLGILDAAFAHGHLTYAKLREIIHIPEVIQFKDPRLDYSKGTKEAEKVKFLEFTQLKALKKALGESYVDIPRSVLDTIAKDIATIKDQEALKAQLAKSLARFSLTPEQIEALSVLDFTKHINLSLRALYEILPYMRGDRGVGDDVEQKCMGYDEAWCAAGLKLKKKTKKDQNIPPLDEFEPHLANPVVARALAEYRKVLNALLKKHGRVHRIHIELTREIGLSAIERKKLESDQKERFSANENARKQCEELGLSPNGRNLLKLKLFFEQGEFCAYSGRKITREHLLDSSALEIDHIYPYSRSFDDSYLNKVLVFAKENQNKGNRTPFEAFGIDTQKWEKIIAFSARLPLKKRRRILNQHFIDREAGFKSRNLNDTGYIASLVADYTDTYIEFLPLEPGENTKLGRGEKGSRNHITTISGTLTATMRYYLGLTNKDRNNHLHHAIDAVLIAFATDSMVKNFAEFKEQQERRSAEYYGRSLRQEQESGKRHKAFFAPAEIPHFREQILAKVERIFVSRPPRTRGRGALHEETFYSMRDKGLLKQYGGEAGLERAIELGKLRKIGTKLVSNGPMVRVDIFTHRQKGGFYGVPIYTMDIALGVLPNKAVVAGKEKSGVIKDWVEMDSAYEFLFSLHKNDLILVQRREMQQPELCYFESFNTSNAQINVKSHDNKFSALTPNQELLFTNATPEEVKGKSIGIKGLKVFEKWQVSVLGEVRKLPYYPRQALVSNRKNMQNKSKPRKKSQGE